ncbi:MAG: polyprenyl synthetase family protein [Chloroflexi bacterium]|nr:polyprenyl synthetase family protein [Chloroflexota bacterium]
MASAVYEQTFTPFLREIEAEMRAARQEQSEIAPILWQVIDYQFGWDIPPEDSARFRKVTGKKIRPLLMALVAQAVRGDYRHVLPAGVALEFVHNFTLIHDDVMDESPERRHRPAVWTRWGPYQAINAGDGLYALSFLASTRLHRIGTPPAKTVRVVEWLARACLQTAEGQILDMDFETRDTVSTDDYITMIANKTGALIECAAGIGALLSTDDEALIAAYTDFGRRLGIAFQVRDDYLGIWGDKAQTGKSTTSDIREKKKSYPVLAAFERAVPADRASLQAIYRQESLSDADIATVMDILERTGAPALTDQIARSYYDGALERLGWTGADQELIRQYAAFLVRREY